MRWQVQQATQRFSALVRRALEEGPQFVTRHGEEIVVVLSARDYRRLTESTPDFAEFLLAAPDFGQLDIRRAADPARAMEL